MAQVCGLNINLCVKPAPRGKPPAPKALALDLEFASIIKEAAELRLSVPSSRGFGYVEDVCNFLNLGTLETNGKKLPLAEALYCGRTRSQLDARLHVVLSTRYRDQDNDADGRLLFHHPYLVSLLIQAFLGKAKAKAKAGTRKEVFAWNPNSSNAALASLIGTTEEEKNCMWLRCFFNALALAQQTCGFVVQPILKEAASPDNPEARSHMQVAEAEMARTLGVAVYCFEYSHNDKLEDLIKHIKECLSQILGLELDASDLDVLRCIEQYHDPAADNCGAVLGAHEEALVRLHQP